MEDARYEDADEGPLRLIARDAEDLEILSALTQDAVFPASEIAWDAPQRRFAVLLNRFRWEDKAAAERRGRPVERVQTVMAVSDVLKVQSQGIEKGDPDMILSLLSLSFVAAEDGMGRLELTLAGDGAIALEVTASRMISKPASPHFCP